MIGAYYFITSLMLIYNTVRDLKTQEIDERFNYLALGATLMLIPILKPSWLLLLVLIFLSILSSIFFKKAMASGDLQALNWIYLGLGIIDYTKVIKFLISLTGLFTLSFAITKLLKANKLAPGYPLILGSYIIAIFW